LDIDDVDAIALSEDIALHLWIPSASLMSKVNTAVEKLSHGYNCHLGTLLLSLSPTFGFTAGKQEHSVCDLAIC
jgi:hypothetical protein